MANKNLNAAKTAKKDEFYTQMTDIERELQHYWPHFRGKTVLCNCDDPYESNFFKYLSEDGILADALVADSCSEWMNMLIRRISDQTQLRCGNLSAVTLKLNS